MTFDAAAVARFIADAHQRRAPYANVPAALGLDTVDDAYAAQEALAGLWNTTRGPVAGLKIATTTKVMQALMGIDHPCGGMIYADTIHASPAALSKRDYMNVVVECELAVRIGLDLPARAQPYDRAGVRSAVQAVMPAFELIEDRNAVYKDTRALSLIADNAWNAGIVIGREVQVAPDIDLDGLDGTLSISNGTTRTGRTDDPMGALAWVANLAAGRGRPLKAGMVVITGSVIATLPIAAGETFAFEIAGLGGVRLTATA